MCDGRTRSARAEPLRKDTALDSLHTPPPIHPIAVRMAFGHDRDHRAIPGTIKGISGDSLRVALADDSWLDVAINNPDFAQALNRDDLCRQNDELVVLVNAYYGLIGLATGVAEPPSRLEVLYGFCRLENGSAVEIPGTHPQPSWLLFRCTARPVHSETAGRP